MSIASEIQRVQGAIADAYDAAEAKGATMPTTENIAALADCIESIPSGGGGLSTEGLTFSQEPSKASDLLFNSMRGVESVTSNVVSISAYEFYGSNIKHFVLDSATSCGADAFEGSKIESISMASMSNGMAQSVYVFRSCNKLTSVNLPLVTAFRGRDFEGCTALTSLSFPNLQTLNGAYTWNGCTNLQSLYIPNLFVSSQSGVFSGCVNLIDITIGTRFTNTTSLLNTWSPTNVLNDATKKATMLQNIREHIAANLPTVSGKTITFSAGVKAAIQADADTAAAFTSKGWTIA